MSSGEEYMGADHYEAGEQEYADYLMLVPHTALPGRLYILRVC